MSLPLGAAVAGRSCSAAARLLPLEDALQLDMILAVGNMEQQIIVKSELTLLEAGASSSGSTIVPAQVESMPINGRNYLDLLQLVPRVAINRQIQRDGSAPILGERAGVSNR